MVNQISKRMLEICAKEGLTVNQATMDALVQVGRAGSQGALGTRLLGCRAHQPTSSCQGLR